MKRIDWLDNAKLFTMLLVIIGHCFYWNISTEYGGVNLINGDYSFSVAYKVINLVIGFIYSFHMPLFMTISGMCFTFSMSREKTFCSLLKSRIYRLIVPFLVVNLFYGIPLKYIAGYWDGSENVFRDMLCGQLLLMGNNHLWYVISLFYICIMYYFMETIRVHKNTAFWLSLFLLSWFGFWLEQKYNFLGIAPALKYLFHFAIGYNMIRFVDKFKPYRLDVICCILIVLFLFNYIFNLKIGTLGFWGMLFQYPVSTCYCVITEFICLLLFKRLGNLIRWETLKNNTYELYLYSDPLNYIVILLVANFVGGSFVESNGLSILLFILRFVVTLLGAILLIKLIKRLNIKAK